MIAVEPMTAISRRSASCVVAASERIVAEFGARVREAELDYLFASPLAQRVFAENYVGLPL